MLDRPSPASLANDGERQYLDLLREALEEGTVKTDRTGTGTRALFGRMMRFDLSRGFPLLTTKKLHTKSIVHELLWLIAGDTNVGYLRENGVTIWDEWADANGDLGPVYGKQWRAWERPDGKVVDQLANAQELIRKSPDSRRIIVNAWNAGELGEMALTPCHAMFQFVVNDGRLSCMLTQRSGDIFLGVPFNIASYALLTHMMAQACDLQVGEFVHSLGDAHLYSNHVEQARLQLSREPLAFPTLRLNPERKSILDFRYDDIAIEGYASHPPIKAPVAV